MKTKHPQYQRRRASRRFIESQIPRFGASQRPVRLRPIVKAWLALLPMAIAPSRPSGCPKPEPQDMATTSSRAERRAALMRFFNFTAGDIAASAALKSALRHETPKNQS